VISGILVIKNTKVRKKRLMPKGGRNSLKIYRCIIFTGIIFDGKYKLAPKVSRHKTNTGFHTCCFVIKMKA
jgi:hypothetical protein